MPPAAPDYASLTRDERIHYWTQKLWYWGREVVDATEDALFEARLVDHMRSVDPAIDDFLPDILRLLADMQHREAAELIAEFNRRTGMNVA